MVGSLKRNSNKLKSRWYLRWSKGDLSTDLPAQQPLKEARNAYEKRYPIHLLETCKNNISNAAILAEKYRADFYDLLKKPDLNSEYWRI